MDIERISRYKDKLNIISERKQDIEEWVSGYDSFDFIEDKKTRLAVYSKDLKINSKGWLYKYRPVVWEKVHK